MQEVRINYNNKCRVISIAKYFQNRNSIFFDIADEHIVLCSNNLEPAIHEQILLAAENGTYNSTIYSFDTVGLLKRSNVGN